MDVNSNLPETVRLSQGHLLFESTNSISGFNSPLFFGNFVLFEHISLIFLISASYNPISTEEYLATKYFLKKEKS